MIPEDLPIGKMGGKVKANDRDVGDNSKSTYSIVEGDDQGVFEIVTDAQTQEGILRLKKVRLETRWKWLKSTLHALSVSDNTTQTQQGRGRRNTAVVSKL